MNKIYHSQLKALASGTVESVFALLNEKDSDSDVTLPGAFGDQSCILEPFNHDYGSLPVGKGAISEEGGKEAVFRGNFFLDTTSGKDHWAALKALGELTQWSYSFRIIKSHKGKWIDGTDVQFLDKLDVFGVSPVTRGAQSRTFTRSIKSEDSDVQRLRAQIDALSTQGGRRTWLPVGLRLDAKTTRRTVEMALDELSDIEARVTRTGERPETGLIGLWRSTLRGEGHSESWIAQVISAEIYGLAELIQQANPLLYPNNTPALALAEARRQLSQPVDPYTGLVWFPQVGAP